MRVLYDSEYRSGELLFHAEKILENTIANVLREAQRHEFNITARPRLIALPRRVPPAAAAAAAGATASDGAQQQQTARAAAAGGDTPRVPMSEPLVASDGALEPAVKTHALKFAQPELTAST